MSKLSDLKSTEPEMEKITVNAIDYLIIEGEFINQYTIKLANGLCINNDWFTVEMKQDNAGEYWEFYGDSEFLVISPHINEFTTHIDAIKWFIETC